ncbi:hypothetical protein MIJ3_00009 [Pseudomonas phage vB_PaeM_MIJ3]|nr:hypothetical protein MIJ3_00009 [Pseudomonas phage vB_PaeM_MIJ3]
MGYELRLSNNYYQNRELTSFPSYQEVVSDWSKATSVNLYDAWEGKAIGGVTAGWSATSILSYTRTPDPISTNAASLYSYALYMDQVSDFNITIKISSSSIRNNRLGLCVAGQKGKYISAVRSLGNTSSSGSGRNWELILDNNKTRTILSSKTIGINSPAGATSTSSTGYLGWSNRYTIINVIRENNKITAKCSDWNSNVILDNSVFTIDLNDDTLTDFKTSALFGFVSGNQDLCTFEVLSFSAKCYNKIPGLNVPDNYISSNLLSISMPGYNSAGYEKAFSESMIWMVENFASSSPPQNAIKGQLWYKTEGPGTQGSFYVYVGEPGEFTNLAKWHPLTQGTLDLLSAHINDKNDPHQVTKEQIGLGLVDNVNTFDKTLNLADVLNKAAARNNLSIYGKNETYNSQEYNNLFVDKSNSSSPDSELLGGLDSTAYVKKQTPFVTSSITSSVTSGDVIVMNDNSFRLAYKPNYGTSLILGGTVTDIHSQNNTTAVSMNMVTNNTLDNGIQFVFYNTGAINTPLVANSIISFKADNLYIGSGNLAFHDRRPPTAAEVGALAWNGTAVDSYLLNGKINSTSPGANTIAVRYTPSNLPDANGGYLSASSFSMTYTNADPMSVNAQVTFRNNNTNDNYVRFASRDQLVTYLGYDWKVEIDMPKGLASFSDTNLTGGSFFVINTLNLSITKLGTGLYRFYFTTLRPTNTNYVVMTQCMSEGHVGAIEGDVVNYSKAFRAVSIYCYNKTLSYFDVASTLNSNFNNNDGTGYQDYSREYDDPGLASLQVYFSSWVNL